LHGCSEAFVVPICPARFANWAASQQNQPMSEHRCCWSSSGCVATCKASSAYKCTRNALQQALHVSLLVLDACMIHKRNTHMRHVHTAKNSMSQPAPLQDSQPCPSQQLHQSLPSSAAPVQYCLLQLPAKACSAPHCWLRIQVC
jgi:hypothetical protein